MMSLRARLAVALTTALVIAACGQTAKLTAPDAPRFDGGHTFGGGNVVDTTTTTAPPGGGAVVSSGGHTFGGGN